MLTKLVNRYTILYTNKQKYGLLDMWEFFSQNEIALYF